MTVLFRCNAGPVVGLGHLTRCRALAYALRDLDQRCVMVGPDQTHAKPKDHEIFEEWIPVPDWPSASADANQLIELARYHQADWLVLDDYRIDESYQLSVRATGIKWLQFDGAADKPLWADIVVNANPAVRAEDYTSVLRNQDAHLLLGPCYAVLRPEFSTVQHRDPGRSIEQVLVTFGGGDDLGAIAFVLSTLLPVLPAGLRFLVISGANNPNNAQIKDWIQAHGCGRVTLHIDPEQVAPLFAACDLAVMAGGTSTYEAACTGLPMLLMTIANNQISQSKAWSELDAAIYLGDLMKVAQQALVDAFTMIRDDGQKRLLMGRRACQSVDGNGAHHVAHCINSAL